MQPEAIVAFGAMLLAPRGGVEFFRRATCRSCLPSPCVVTRPDFFNGNIRLFEDMYAVVGRVETPLESFTVDAASTRR